MSENNPTTPATQMASIVANMPPSQGTQLADMCCDDPSRPGQGHWALDVSMNDRVIQLHAENPSLTAAEMFQMLGARWIPQNPKEVMRFLYKDPERTIRTRVDDGVEFSGGWCATEAQKIETDRLKQEHPDWSWRKCYEAAGAEWMALYFEHMTEEGLQNVRDSGEGDWRPQSEIGA